MSTAPLKGPWLVVVLGQVEQALNLAVALPDHPAVRALPEAQRTVLGLAEAYLPRSMWLDTAPFPGPDGQYSVHRNRFSEQIRNCLTHRSWLNTPLDLTDAGTRNGLAVAMALALGHDPTDGVIWTRVEGGGGWRLRTDSFVDFDDFEGIVAGGQVLYAPGVNSERDRVSALALAFLHVLAAKAGETEVTS
jgi:hypothetical protein